ncbi:hypothetical protein IFO70_24225 [Phormidium tenue FACHB-886]|nr:hypothetical protein [Phormidium tenue FACHB-886]
MSQTLRAQFSSIAAMDVYRWQQRLDQTHSNLDSAKRSRNRGVLLSQQGWQKLIQAGVLYNECGERYTYEQLSEQSLLDMRTISRLLSCEVKVDKRTLKTFFRAFNLPLEAGDYTSSQGDGVNGVKLDASAQTTLTIHRVEFEQLVEELRQLKQCIRDYDRLLHRLGFSENCVNSHLGS